MTTAQTPTMTPASAFRALQEKICRSDDTSRATTLFGTGAHGEDHALDTRVPDQMVALPRRRVDMRVRLRVATLSDNVLVIQLTGGWQSVYGHHLTIAAYQITLEGDDVTIASTWSQSVPTPALDNIEVHTGNVTVNQYHQNTLDWLRSSGSSAASKMLFDGNAEHLVPADEFLPLATQTLGLMIEL